MNHVFETAELLEAILLDVDLKTLLLSQLVNTTWRNVIAGSSKLQKKLLLKPMRSFEEVEESGVFENSDMVMIWKANDPGVHGVYLLNPLLVDITSWAYNSCTKCGLPYGNFQFTGSFLPDTVSVRSGKSSWERMYLCQPRELMELEITCELGYSLFVKYEKSWPQECISMFYSGTSLSLRQVLDRVEEDALQKYHMSVDWRSVMLLFRDHAVTFEEWTEGEHKDWLAGDSDDEGT